MDRFSVGFCPKSGPFLKYHKHHGQLYLIKSGIIEEAEVDKLVFQPLAAGQSEKINAEKLLGVALGKVVAQELKEIILADITDGSLETLGSGLPINQTLVQNDKIFLLDSAGDIFVYAKTP